MTVFCKRIYVFSNFATEPKKALNVSELQRYLAMPQSTVSQHLSKLKIHKVVAYERKGLEVFYRVDDEKVKQIMKTLIC
ncbi:helix-turn-helix transcriptional regulator [Bacillus cereus group sp. N6]|uniref:metalloregulator ArsR/SmtB family transcription factor n=1 Tax=Bacillus cereus group sp. N6 TaxID=2794583 RepID=UPI0018F60B78|nr:helix-turn-helix transcriptional regulator [Bacillus cereus group sp. N6]